MRLIQFASPHVVEFQFCDQCGGRIRLDCDEPVSDLRRDVSNRIPRLFAAGSYTVDGELRQFQVCTADERTQLVRACSNPEQLREALASTGLQSTVRAAIERRLRQLERAP